MHALLLVHITGELTTYYVHDFLCVMLLNSQSSWHAWLNSIYHMTTFHNSIYRLLFFFSLQAYVSRYATKEKLLRKPTNEDLARIHKGGPNGHKSALSARYWLLVSEQLKWTI